MGKGVQDRKRNSSRKQGWQGDKTTATVRIDDIVSKAYGANWLNPNQIKHTCVTVDTA